MFVFGSAAKADADGDDGGGGRGKALSTTDGPPSFAFDASFLSAVTSTTTANGDDAHAAAGGFKFKMPSSQAATEGGEVGDSTPLFGSTLKSRQEVGVGVKTQMKHEAATDGSSNPMGDQLQQAATEPEGFLLYEGGEVAEELRSSLTHVRIAPHVNEIQNGAFCSSDKLIKLQLNEGLQVIGDSAFEGCKSLQSVTIPSSVTEMGWKAFCSCSGLDDLQLKEGLQVIGEYAFGSCLALRSVTIPSSVTALGKGAFFCCMNLSEVIFQDGKRFLRQEFFSRGIFSEARGLLDQEALDEIFNENEVFTFGWCPLTTVKISISSTVSERMARLPRECILSVEEKIHNLNLLDLLPDGDIMACFPVVRMATGDEAGDDSDDDQDDTYEVQDTNNETAKSLYQVLQLIAFHELKESSIVIELAVWKLKIDEPASVAREDCRVAIPDPAKSLIMEYCGFAGFLEPAIEGA